jgi:23S rRNA (cytosine1962-C5)-methyltransferase
MSKRPFQQNRFSGPPGKSPRPAWSKPDVASSPHGPAALQPRPLAPDATQPLPRVRVKSLSLNPTVYRKRIDEVERTARPGDLVAVHDEFERLLGYGLYNPKSEIAVRMVRFEPQLPDNAFWDDLLQRAVSLRRDLLKLDDVTDAYRVIHAESDGFPGLVVDKIGDVLSAEVFSLGMYQRAQDIAARLEPLLGTKHTLIRPAPYVLSQEGFEGPGFSSPDVPSRVTIQEFGTRFRVHFETGHKTGFFCDQRDNRRMLASFCAGKSVLDLCCYSGGFSVQAKKLGNAAEVTGVDLDENAVAMAKENANLNQARVRFVHADAFAYMRDMLSNGRQFDVVVLDPPKLIRNRDELDEGTRKHFALNRLAMQLVAPGGLLLTCTCAGLLSGEEFKNLVTTASRQCGRVIEPATEERPEKRGARVGQILFKTGAAADHPVATQCPETEYLQAMWLRLI